MNRVHRNFGLAGRSDVEGRERLVDRVYFVLFGILLAIMAMGWAGVIGAVIWWLLFSE